MSAAEGDKAFADAEKKLKGNMFGLGKDPDAAVDCFKRACNNYKVAGNYADAAKCQERIAKVGESQGEFYETAAACMEASKLYMKDKNMSAATGALQRARNLYVQHGKISQAARACKELANALRDSGEPDAARLALETYHEAARMFETDSAYTDMNKMRLEAAALHVDMKQNKEAAKLYESVANEYVANNLLKYSAKDLFMNALLCVLAEGDTTAAMAKREEYRTADVQFEGSRQEKLVSDCLNAMLGSSPDDFATAVAEWESMTKLEPFRVKLLLAAKESISVGGPDLLDDGDDLDLT